MAEETGDPELELQGAGWTIIDLMELGDIDGVDIQIAAVSKLAEALHRPIWLWWTSLFRGARAQLAGEFDEAERLAQETLAIGQRGQAENALHYYAQAMFNIRREQGRLAEVEGAVRGFIELYPAIPAWRGALALLLVELGPPGRGARRVRAGRRGRLRRLPARRELADRDHADGRGLRRAGRRGARGGALPAARALRGPQRRRRPQRDLQRLRARGLLRASSRPRAASTRWPSATSTTPRRCTRRWARGPGTRARRSSYAEMLLARRGPGDVERATRDARRRDPRRRRAGDGRAGRAGAAARADAPAWRVSRGCAVVTFLDGRAALARAHAGLLRGAAAHAARAGRRRARHRHARRRDPRRRRARDGRAGRARAAARSDRRA